MDNLNEHPRHSVTTIYILEKRETVADHVTPTNRVNQNLHIRHVQLQMRLWKATDQQGAPDISISYFGWEINGMLPCPCVNNGPPAPPTLMNVISCRCWAKEKACKEAKRSCHHEKLRLHILLPLCSR